MTIEELKNMLNSIGIEHLNSDDVKKIINEIKKNNQKK